MNKRDLLLELAASLAGACASARESVPAQEPEPVGFTGFCPPLPEYLCGR